MDKNNRLIHESDVSKASEVDDTDEGKRNSISMHEANDSQNFDAQSLPKQEAGQVLRRGTRTRFSPLRYGYYG